MKFTQELKSGLNRDIGQFLPWREIVLVVAIFTMVVFDLVMFSYVAVKYAYRGRIYPGTKVAGVDIGGKTFPQARRILNNQLGTSQNQEISLAVAGHLYQVDLSEMGISLDRERALRQAYYHCRTGGLIGQSRNIINIFTNGLSVPMAFSVNRQQFDTYLQNIAKTSSRPATNASIRLLNGEFMVMGGTLGVGIDKEKLAAFILNTLEDNLNQPQWHQFIYEVNTVAPKIQANDLFDAKAKAESLTKQTFIFTYENRSIKASSAEIGKWVKFIAVDGAYQPVINQSAIEKYVNKLAGQIDRRVIDTKVSSKDNRIVEHGKDGQVLLRDQTVSDILYSLSGNGSRTIALQVQKRKHGKKKVRPAFNPGLYDGKYIEINLSRQRLYLWDGEEKIASYLVSTGKWSMPTPTGTRYIQGKTRRAYSRKYGLYMPWWNSIGGGYGIHELPEWPNGYKEGKWHLGIPVSHGCIRLGVGPAKRVYKWAPVGTPVYIHK